MPAPEPFFLTQKSFGGSIQEQARCRRARDAIRAFLKSGDEIGEPELFYTAAVMAPFITFYVKTAEELQSRANTLGQTGQIDSQDPIFDELDDLSDLANIYKDILIEASLSPIAVQRDILFRFVISPMFLGEGYEVPFDEETPVVDMTPTYCWPTRIAAKMQVSINNYDHFWRQVTAFTSWAGWGIYNASIWPAKTTIDLLSDKISEEMHEAMPYNEAVVIFHEHTDPVIKDAKAARDAVLGAAEAVGKAAAKTVRMWPWVLGTGAIGLGTYFYLTKDKK